jgi:hypothetical protein
MAGNPGGLQLHPAKRLAAHVIAGNQVQKLRVHASRSETHMAQLAFAKNSKVFDFPLSHGMNIANFWRCSR